MVRLLLIALLVSTLTTAPIKCVIENQSALTLAIITAGITINSVAAGMVVQVIALPPS